MRLVGLELGADTFDLYPTVFWAGFVGNIPFMLYLGGFVAVGFGFENLAFLTAAVNKTVQDRHAGRLYRNRGQCDAQVPFCSQQR